jgi:hypothetical protein
MFIQFDDFSHWGIVVKDMLCYDRLPNMQSTVIMFKSYPPASSLFIYFTCRIIGISQSKMLISQAYLMLACVLPLFGISNKSKLANVIAFAASVFMIIGQRSFIGLSVDTLLPLAGIAATAIIFYYRHDLKKACLLALPIMIVTILMKNSGIFFVFINSILLAHYALRTKKLNPDLEKREKKIIYLYVFGTILLSFFMLVLWYTHVSYVFPDINNKHAMSLGNYEKVFSEKTPEDIQSIVNSFIFKLFDINTISTLTMVILNAGILILAFVNRIILRNTMKGLIKSLIISDILFIIYEAGNLGMYLFSMPSSEATRLASYDRYVSTIIIYILGILVIGFSLDFDKQSLLNEKSFNILAKKSILLCMMVLVFLFSGIISIQPTETANALNIPQKLDTLVGDARHYSSTRYLVYSKTDKYYVYFVTMYYTFSSNIKVLEDIPSKDKFLKELSSYDYFIVLEDDAAAAKLMSQYCSKKSYYGKYSVKNTFF